MAQREEIVLDVSIALGEMAGVAGYEPCGAALQHEDGAIIVRAQAGDRQAFETLLCRYESMVYRTALRLLGNSEDAKDCAQEVFLSLYQHLGRIHVDRPLAPWLYRVTVNASRDMAKKRARQSRGASQEKNVGVIPSGPRPDRALEMAETRALMNEGLETLPQKERAALVLRDLEGLSTHEVAVILGSSQVTVRSQISRARSKMK